MINYLYIFHPQYSIFMAQTAVSILLQCSLWNTTGRSLSGNLFVTMVFKLPMYSVHHLKANVFVDSLKLLFYDGCINQQGNLHSQLLFVVIIIKIILLYYFEIYELTLMFYIFAFILSSIYNNNNNIIILTATIKDSESMLNYLVEYLLLLIA